MTVPFSLPLFTVAAVQSARASHARREEQEADDQRYATLRREQAQFRSLDDKPLLVDEPMIEQNRPITPPPELVEQWHLEAMKAFRDYDIYRQDIATQAARWGADQELEACCEWVSQWCGRWSDGSRPEDGLRAARRPESKPLSLKEQALEELENMIKAAKDFGFGGTDPQAIRKALEQLND